MILNLWSQWENFYDILFDLILEVAAFNSTRIISMLFLASQTIIDQKTTSKYNFSYFNKVERDTKVEKNYIT